jgi:hypothetical protein
MKTHKVSRVPSSNISGFMPEEKKKTAWAV